MGFRELSDEEWEIIRPLLPPRASVGRPRIDDRLIVNGILYVLDAVGWIYLLGMVHTRPAGIGLRSGVLWAYGLRFLKP
jgi:transposase